MKLRKLYWLLLLPVILLGAIVSGWFFTLHTEAGARWLFERAASASGGQFSAGRIDGDMASGLHLERFRFEDGSMIVAAEQIEAGVRLELFPLTVRVDKLHASTLTVQPLNTATGDSDRGDALPIPRLPFALHFSDIRLKEIEYLDPVGENSLVITSIEAAGILDRSLLLQRLAITLPEQKAEMNGQLGLEPPHSVSLDFIMTGELELNGSLEGSLESALILVESADPEARIEGTVGALLTKPVWDLRISSSLVSAPAQQGSEPTAELRDVEAHFKGEWPNFNLDIDAAVEAAGLPPSQLSLSGDGTPDDFTVRQMELEGSGLSMNARGYLSWKDAIELEIDAVLDRLDVHGWLPDWPQAHPLEGAFAIHWAGDNLTVRHFKLSVTDTATVANGHGVLALASGVVDLELNWRDFSWPPADRQPVILSRKGMMQVTGRPEDWRLNGTLDLQSGELPAGRLQLSGTGNEEAFDLTIEEGAVLGGTFAGNLSWSWVGIQPFELDVVADRLDVTNLLPDYPGVVSTSLRASGDIEPLRVDVMIRNLDGVIRQLPVAGEGRILYQRERLFADGLKLTSGASTVALDGSLYEAAGIDFRIDIDSLGAFSNDLEGHIAVAGNVSLNPQKPRVSADLSGKDLAIGPIRIEQLETRRLPGADDGSEVILTGMNIGLRSIDSLRLGFAGEEPLSRISLNAAIEGIDLSMDLDGSVIDWRDPLASGWSGTLSRSEIDYQRQFTLTQNEAAGMSWSLSQFNLDEVCFSGLRDARLCAVSAWTAPDRLDIAADMIAVPVGLIELAVNTELRFTQMLDGKLEWTQTADSQTGSARLEISPGAIHLVDDDIMLVETGPGEFGFTLSGGNLSAGSLRLNIPGSGDIDVAFNVPDLVKGAYSPVQGKARIDLSDLGKFNQVIPLFDSVSGAFEADLEISGIVSDPAWSGRATLTDVLVANRTSGFSFSEINLSGEVSDSDRALLNGTYRAGEGSGKIAATLYFDDLLSPVIDLSLNGTALTLIDVPDLELIANPDIRLNWSRNTLQVGGKLLIPKARLSPSALPRDAVRQSSDVVIVAGDLPEQEPDFLRDNTIRIRGELEVELGDECEIELDFADVGVFGATRFTWSDNVIPLAEGHFDMRGEIQAYGQLLRITSGRIGFPGVPADNPFLNIRAEREIYGNSQIRKAGLLVAGTLRRPLMEPYTVPMTSKERAQTLLVTGSDFNYEQGVGAVAVGTYILPRLYVSYGIGVFEEGNVFSVRYDLGKGFGVKATSGDRATGLDLNYTIER